MCFDIYLKMILMTEDRHKDVLISPEHSLQT